MPREFIQHVNPTLANTPLLGTLLFDDFSAGLFWTATGTGTDYQLELVHSRPLVSPVALFMATRKTSPAADDYVAAARYTMAAQEGKLTLAILLDLLNISNTKLVQITMYNWNASGYYIPVWTYDAENAKWQYRNSAGSTVDITDGAQTIGAERVLIQAAVDLDAGTYLYLHSVDKHFDMSALDMELSTASTGLHHWIEVRITTRAGTQTTAYVHMVHLTHYK